jgi:hypothetical protein
MSASAAAASPAFPLQGLLGRVALQVRLRRAEAGAWRGAFWGALAAVAILVFKEPLGETAVPAALVALAVGAAAWALRSACRPVAPLTAARLADTTLGLHDRVSSALEWFGKAEAGPLSRALVADAVLRVGEISDLPRRRFLSRQPPREAQLLVIPLLAIAVLAYAPAMPGPGEWLQQLRAEKPRNESATVSLMDRLKQMGGNLLQKNPFAAQDAAASATPEGRSPTEAAEFKDKAISKNKSDFSSFIKKGDERLRMLERTDRLPDLQSDFASSKYRMLLRKSQELSAGKGPGQLSPAKLAQILREMERMGKRGGEWSDDVNEGFEALNEGNMDDAMEAVESALGKIRDAENRQRASKTLRGGRDATDEADASRSDQSSMAMNDIERRGGYSQAKGGASKGTPSSRLRSTPYDTGIQGQRGGRMPSYETQNTGRPGALGMQLQYLGEVGQYRRQMEDAIAREQVPRDYHNQIRDYFKSLTEQ